MKRITAILLCLSLSLFMLGGCKAGKDSSSPAAGEESSAKEDTSFESGEASAQEIIDNVLANLKDVESLHMEIEADSSMNIMGNKVDSKTRAISNVDIKEKVQYIDMTMDAAAQQSRVEGYVKGSGSGADVYVLANGTWVKQTSIPSDKVNELGLSTDTYELMNLYLVSIQEECELSEEKIDGKECYVFSGTIDAKEEILEKVGLGNILKMLVQNGITSSQIDEIISNVEGFEVVIAVDKESLLPVQIEVDITDVTQDIMDGLVETLGETGEIKVEKNIAVSKYSQYNGIDEIVIPEEALNAKETVLY